MNIVLPYSRIIHFDEDGNKADFTIRHGIGLLRKIEWNARLSHASEDRQTASSWDNFLRRVVLEHGDWSVVEHATLTVDTIVDRGVTHEWVRHRLASYTQSSTRFINYAKKMPASFVFPFQSGSDNSYEATAWREGIEVAEKTYKNMISVGCAPQIARSVLPNALASRISTTCNLRNWRHMFIMRTTKEAHPQMKQIMIPLLEEFKVKIPIIFEDLEPNSRQIDNLRKPR